MKLQNKRVFIVEDNLSNKAITQLLLERDGARVTIDRWGIDAVDRMRRMDHLDIILLDLMFPGFVTGYDVFQQIRQCPELDNVPVVAVSAADASIAMPKTQQMGFAGFIGKPLDFINFSSQVQTVIAGQSIWYAPDEPYMGV